MTYFLNFSKQNFDFFIKYMKKIGQFYVTYQKFVQFECRLWKLLGLKKCPRLAEQPGIYSSSNYLACSLYL